MALVEFSGDEPMMRRRALCVLYLANLVVAGACVGSEDPGPSDDRDGDGASDASDCEPDDPSIHPGADEICDEVDQDCNGIVDDNATDAQTWFVDSDQDGFGVVGDETLACVQPDGHAARSDDCNDQQASVFPGAVELCGDGFINDCDGAGPLCRIVGTINLSEAEVLGNVQASRCQAFMDIDGDGVLDASCGSASYVSGPIIEGAMRPQWLVERELVTGTTGIADVDGDGQVDILVDHPATREVDVYKGPWSTVLGERSSVRLSYAEGWTPVVYRSEGNAASMALRALDNTEVRWSKAPFDESSDLAVGAEWRFQGANAFQIIPDLDRDGQEDVLVLPSSNGLNQVVVSGASGMWDFESRMWSPKTQDALWIGRHTIVQYQDLGPGVYGINSLDREDGEVVELLLEIDRSSGGDSDPCPTPAGFADINGDGEDDLFLLDACSDTFLSAWFGPINGPLELETADIRVVSDVVEGARASAGFVQAVDLDNDGLKELVVAVNSTIGGTNAESVVFRGNRP